MNGLGNLLSISGRDPRRRGPVGVARAIVAVAVPPTAAVEVTAACAGLVADAVFVSAVLLVPDLPKADLLVPDLLVPDLLVADLPTAELVVADLPVPDDPPAPTSNVLPHALHVTGPTIEPGKAS